MTDIIRLHSNAPTGEQGRVFQRHHDWTVYQFAKPVKPSNPLVVLRRALLKRRSAS